MYVFKHFPLWGRYNFANIALIYTYEYFFIYVIYCKSDFIKIFFGNRYSKKYGLSKKIMCL